MKKERGNYIGLYAKNDTGSKICLPYIVNMDEMFFRFAHTSRRKWPLNKVCKDIEKILATTVEDENSFDWISDWNIVKNRLFFSLCSMSNMEYLEKKIWKDIPGTDLVLLPRIFVFENTVNGFGSVVFNDDMLKYLGVSRSDVIKATEMSSLNLQSASIKISPNFVPVTSDFGSYGAATFFYDGIIDKVVDIIGKTMYIVNISSRQLLGY